MQSHLELIAEVQQDAERLRATFFATAAPLIVAAAEAMAACLRDGGKILLYGNGGSAADAQHLAAEFVNKLRDDREALAALALTTDSSILTSVANDSHYDQTFSRQIAALGRAGDVSLGITTSGNSANVLEALKLSRQRELVTIGLLGRDGGRAAELCQHPLVVPHHETQRVQEIHIMVGHLLAELTERMLLQPVVAP